MSAQPIRSIGIGLVLALLGGACRDDGGRADLGRPSGFVVISLSGLRPDVLGFHGFEPSPSPFLDSLARRALVYEQALSTSPDTLVAHVSLLSGLYPAEHRVLPPAGTLAAEVGVLPELFAENGYRTAGFTSGGYVSADFGFDRGFDRFEVVAAGADSPFDRGIAFLEGVADAPFFVFLQSDALEANLFGPPADSKADEPDWHRLDVNRVSGDGQVEPTGLKSRLVSDYLDGVGLLDRDLESFFEALDALDLGGRTVVAITADHGFEFWEHGRLGHAQVYPETLRVPLVLVGPGLRASRVETLAQSVDIAPSLCSLAGISIPDLSGRVLPGLPDAVEPRRWAAAEVRGRWAQETLLQEIDGRVHQGVRSHLRGEYDGTWVTRAVTFDTDAERLEFSAVSFLEPRTVSLVLDGHEIDRLEIGPDWVDLSVPLPPNSGRRRLTLSTNDCKSPLDAGAGSDQRCLSFKLRGLGLSKFELFDLASDPAADLDLSTTRPDLAEMLRTRLARRDWPKTALPGTTSPRDATLAAIIARGEYPEPPGPEAPR